MQVQEKVGDVEEYLVAQEKHEVTTLPTPPHTPPHSRWLWHDHVRRSCRTESDYSAAVQQHLDAHMHFSPPPPPVKPRFKRFTPLNYK